MKFIGTKRVKIEALKLPGDWKKILKSDDAGTLAESLAHVPILQRPGVRKKDRAVIWGRHRLAALWIDGQRTAEVDVWDASDEELELAKDIENAFRRGPDVPARMRLIERWAKEIAEARDADNPGQPSGVVTSETNLPRGPQKTPRGEARARVAAMTGQTPEAVRKQEQRARAKAEEPPPADPWGDEGETKADGPKFPWLGRLGAFETWGIVIEDEFARTVVETRRAVDDVVNRMQATLAAITTLTSFGNPKAIGEEVAADLDLQGLYTRLQAQAGALRAMWPVALCCYCKAQPVLLRHCKGCRGRSTVGKEELERAPKELRVGGAEAGVYVGPNEFRRLSELEAA